MTLYLVVAQVGEYEPLEAEFTAPSSAQALHAIIDRLLLSPLPADAEIQLLVQPVRRVGGSDGVSQIITPEGNITLRVEPELEG